MYKPTGMRSIYSQPTSNLEKKEIRKYSFQARKPLVWKPVCKTWLCMLAHAHNLRCSEGWSERLTNSRPAWQPSKTLLSWYKVKRGWSRTLAQHTWDLKDTSHEAMGEKSLARETEIQKPHQYCPLFICLTIMKCKMGLGTCGDTAIHQHLFCHYHRLNLGSHTCQRALLPSYIPQW